MELIKRSELLNQSAIDILYYIQFTDQIAAAGMAHSCVSVFGLTNNESYSLVQNLQDRTAAVTGICEIESLK